MPAPILASPFLTLEVVDRALQGTTEPGERVKLLSARVHLLSEAAAAASTAPSAAGQPRPRPAPTPLLAARADLAEAYLSLPVPELHAAEAECLAVQAECRRLLKRDGGDSRAEIAAVRERVLALLVRVEEGLGRPARAERWRGMMSG